MINEDTAKSMLEEFVGCDSDNPGNPERPAVWLFGIEHGEIGTIANSSPSIEPVDCYSIKTQLGFRSPFNRNAFKLLAAMNGYQVAQFRKFAEEHQPFVRRGRSENIKGNGNLYFKGNLYPYACKKVKIWPEDAIRETGISDKNKYQQWCLRHRFPVIKQWVDKYQPKIFIGVGITCRDEFSSAVFGRVVNFELHQFSVNKHGKKIYFASVDGIKLVVIPHLSGSQYGLNSDESLQEAGEFIAGL